MKTRKNLKIWLAAIILVSMTGLWKPIVQQSTASPANTAICGSDSALVGCWQMDDGLKDQILDGTDNHNNATLNGYSQVENPYIIWDLNRALLMDGSTQFAIVPDNDTLDITSSITLMAWIRPEKIGEQYLIKKADATNDGYELSLGSDGRAFFRLNSKTWGSVYKLSASTYTFYPTDSKTWVHIAATFEQGNMKIYINGALDNSKTREPLIIGSNNIPLVVGAQYNTTIYRFKGAIDDVRVYNRALTEAEIQALIQPLAVDVSSFQVNPTPGGMQIHWNTASEVDLLGFNLLRANAPEGVQAQLNDQLIPAQTPGSLVGNTYHFQDANVQPGHTYYYWIELVMLDGSRQVGPTPGRTYSPNWIFLPFIHQ